MRVNQHIDGDLDSGCETRKAASVGRGGGGDLSAKEHMREDDIVRMVREQYRLHPFPPPQRRHGYVGHARYLKLAMKSAGIDLEHSRVGDIACGSGLMLADLAGELAEAEVVGYDLSDVSVKLAEATLREEGHHNARAQVCNILEMDEAESFDAIVSWGTIHHLPQPREGIARLARALKPGGVLRVGVYGYYGNWERRVQRELVATLCDGNDSGQELDQDEKIKVVREWAAGDSRFDRRHTAPPVDLDVDAWVVDEFLHVWERHERLKDMVGWLAAAGMQVLALSDYDNHDIPLDIACHTSSPALQQRVRALPFVARCHVIDLMVRPYWLAILARKGAGSP